MLRFRKVALAVLVCVFVVSFFCVTDSSFLAILLSFEEWNLVLSIFYFSIQTLKFYDKRRTYKLNRLLHTLLTNTMTSTIVFWVISFPSHLSQQKAVSFDWYLIKTLYFNTLTCITPLSLLFIDFFRNKVILGKKSVLSLTLFLSLYFLTCFIFNQFYAQNVLSVIPYNKPYAYLLLLSFFTLSYINWLIILLIFKKKEEQRTKNIIIFN